MSPDEITQALIALLHTDPRAHSDDVLWRLESKCILAGRRLGRELAARAHRASRRSPDLAEHSGPSRLPGPRSLRGGR